MRGALSYNEQKVGQGTAELIFASNFGRDISEMGFSEKLRRFEKLTQLNEKSQTNTLHLSLNFSPDDRLDTETMQTIAVDYMERIGFAGQPYLVYQHNDTAHPHIHIVTTTIKANGKAIYLHNIGKTKSEPARKAMETEYGLIKAESRKQTKEQSFEKMAISPANYGKAETKRAISNIVSEVVSTYKYTSIEELNAALRQFNVTADTGRPGTKMHEHRGLTFSLLDREGYKIGIPIKASSIYSSPMYSTLEKKFEKNKLSRIATRRFTSNSINAALVKCQNERHFTEILRSKNIFLHVSSTVNGKVDKISFVDNRNKTVFTNYDLGWSIEQLFDLLEQKQNSLPKDKKDPISAFGSNSQESLKTSPTFEMIKNLLTAENYGQDISPEFFKKKRKKRKI